MSVVGAPRKREPCLSNCETCDHKKHFDYGHCYMFREAPEGICYSHTELLPPFENLVGLIRSGHEWMRSQRAASDGTTAAAPLPTARDAQMKKEST